jgi:aspartate 1-decarboxylase
MFAFFNIIECSITYWHKSYVNWHYKCLQLIKNVFKQRVIKLNVWEIIMIMRSVMVIKLHGICVTRCDLYYSGPIILPPRILASSNLMAGDAVSIYNFNNRTRYDTYVISGEDDITVGINGPSARLCYKDDSIVVVQYVMTDEEIESRVLFFNLDNQQVDQESVF